MRMLDFTDSPKIQWLKTMICYFLYRSAGLSWLVLLPTWYRLGSHVWLYSAGTSTGTAVPLVALFLCLAPQLGVQNSQGLARPLSTQVSHFEQSSPSCFTQGLGPKWKLQGLIRPRPRSGSPGPSTKPAQIQREENRFHLWVGGRTAYCLSLQTVNQKHLIKLRSYLFLYSPNLQRFAENSNY